MLLYILFFVYLFACYYLITKNSFFKNSNIPTSYLLFLLIIKIAAGFIYYYYFSLPAHIKTSDTIIFFNESIGETNKLLNNPKLFFRELWYNQYNQNNGLFTGVHSFWNDLKMTVFVKMLAILNLFSFKNYHINLIFFNLYVLIGGIVFYKLINYYFNIKAWILLLTIFLIPSSLFWLSGLHKDGIVFVCIAIILYSFHCFINDILSKKIIVIAFAHIVLLFLIRNYVLLALAPILFAWWCSVKFNWDAKKVFIAVFVFCLAGLVFSSLTTVTSGVSSSVVQKHQEFQLLEGNTKFATPLLENNSKSIINYFPFALKTVLFQPEFNTSNSVFSNISALENYCCLLFSIVALFFFFSKKKLNTPIILTLISFTLFMYIFIGYTVCFGGAIARYRSIILPFTLVPYLILIFGKVKPENQS